MIWVRLNNAKTNMCIIIDKINNKNNLILVFSYACPDAEYKKFEIPEIINNLFIIIFWKCSF